MRTVLVFLCVVGVAACRNIREVPQYDNYICPGEVAMSHMSYCAWDPCMAYDDIPQPCENHPDAYCKYDACPNINCDVQFFVGNEYVVCQLKNITGV